MMDRPGRGSSGQGVRQGAGALLLAALGYLPATVGIASPPEYPPHRARPGDPGCSRIRHTGPSGPVRGARRPHIRPQGHCGW